MKRTEIIVSGALLLASWALPAEAIRNGDPERRVQYNGVGAILPGPGHPPCTGTLVTPA